MLSLGLRTFKFFAALIVLWFAATLIAPILLGVLLGIWDFISKQMGV